MRVIEGGWWYTWGERENRWFGCEVGVVVISGEGSGASEIVLQLQ